MVKRWLLHIFFWILYLLQDSLLVFTWVGPSLEKMSDGRLILVSFEAAFIMLLPKLVITYFILYVSLRKIADETVSLFYCILEIFLVLAVSLAFYRALSSYYVNPVIYGGALKPGGFFDIRRILMAIMDIGFVTGMAVAIKLVRIQLAAKEKEKELVRERMGAELKFLRNQTNPHFLMNTLNNIYALARKKSDDTPELVMKLSELLRFMLYESNEPFITLTDEIKVLTDYLELEKMRYNERLTVTFHKETDSEHYMIAPLLLLPFVENAFKHGVSETRFNSFIAIDMQVKEGILVFRIRNSREASGGPVKVNSIGLTNVRRQLELIYKEYKLEASSDEHAFNVFLSLNLNKYASI